MPEDPYCETAPTQPHQPSPPLQWRGDNASLLSHITYSPPGQIKHVICGSIVGKRRAIVAQRRDLGLRIWDFNRLRVYTT